MNTFVARKMYWWSLVGCITITAICAGCNLSSTREQENEIAIPPTQNSSSLNQVEVAVSPTADGTYAEPQNTGAASPSQAAPGDDSEIYLVPINDLGDELTPFTKKENACVIYVRQSTQGIHIYPDLAHTFNDYHIGLLLASDGVVKVEKISWGQFQRFRWAFISVRGQSGWVHADPPWTSEFPVCATGKLQG